MTITDRPTDTNAATKQTKKGDQKVIFKNCGSFTDCINEINNTQVDNTKDLDVVMSMYNLIKCSDNYSKTYGCLWQYFRKKPDEANNVAITDSKLFKSKTKLTAKTSVAGNRKDVEIAVPWTVRLSLLKEFFRGLLKCF